MPRLDQDTINEALRQFQRKKVFNVEQLALVLKCSIPNVRLKLKKWRAYTSYNQNGRFYALPQVPRFDRHGLWRYKDAAFSMHGNLKKTIVQLVTSAPAGLSGRQLGDILGLSPQSFLHHFRKCPGIYREKHDGVYVYFSDDASVYERQVQKRRSSFPRPLLVTLTDPEAIMILVAIIKHHGISAEDIQALPEIKRSKIKFTVIKSFLEYHGLEKKTPVSKP